MSSWKTCQVEDAHCSLLLGATRLRINRHFCAFFLFLHIFALTFLFLYFALLGATRLRINSLFCAFSSLINIFALIFCFQGVTRLRINSCSSSAFIFKLCSLVGGKYIQKGLIFILLFAIKVYADNISIYPGR